MCIRDRCCPYYNVNGAIAYQPNAWIDWLMLAILSSLAASLVRVSLTSFSGGVTIYLELQEKEKEKDENLMNLPVLVVDDDKTCCESTIATLKEIGITGEWVLSGREAVEMCIRDRSDTYR